MKCKKHEENNIKCNECKHAILNNIINAAIERKAKQLQDSP